MTSTLLVILIAAATVAFGAVYPWGYWPMFGAAAAIGLTGLVRGGVRRDTRALAAGLLALAVVVIVQLIPLPSAWLDTISPSAAWLLQQYQADFTIAGTRTAHPLSIEPEATRLGLAALVALALYLLGLPYLLRGRTMRTFPAALAIFTVALALFGLLSRQELNGMVYWFWKPHEGGGKNLFGPFVNRNHFAGWMLMALCVLIGSLMGQIERTLPDMKPGRTRVVAWLSSPQAGGLYLTAGAAVLGALSLIWTLSRSGILAFMVALTAFAWLMARRRRLSLAWRAGVGVALVGVAVAAMLWRVSVNDTSWLRNPQDLFTRLDAWRDGWHLIRDFVWCGVGLNAYPTAMLFYQTKNLDMYVAQAHNDYLQLLAEGGVLMVIPALFAMAMLVRSVRRNLAAVRHENRGYWIRAGAAVGMIAIASQELVEFSLQIPANALLFCTLAALALAPVEGQSAVRGSSRSA
jgi:O-antigen ligase